MFLTSPDQLRELWQGREHPVRYAVETGTFRGESALKLSPAVRHWITIDINPACSALARRRCSEAGRANVECLTGDSREMLPHVLKKIREPCMIMLDAHFSKPKRKLFPDEPDLVNNAGADFPLIEELRIVSERKYADIILVDDIGLFGQKRNDLRAHDAKGNVIDDTPQWEAMSNGRVLRELGRVVCMRYVKNAMVIWRNGRLEPE